MLRSMTGFARETVETAQGTLSCELRAVNHRYLDVQFRLPDELRPHESELRGRIAGSLRRGKVECALFFRRDKMTGADLQLNTQLVQLIGRRGKEVAEEIGDTAAINPIDVMRWPGVITEAEIDAGPLFEAACDVLDRALAAMSEMRGSEGQRLQSLIEARCDDIARIAESVKTRMPEVLEAAHERQRERLARLSVDADEGRLETELALLAQKLDVDEELDRLDSHLTEITDTLKRDESVGRRLDFLMQELNREANTLGSKSADAQTTKAAVELKVLIEQMREQIQNVE